MKKYEIVFILDDQRINDGGDAFVQAAEALIGKLGGSVSARESMGQRQMVSTIRKRNTGLYWCIEAELPEAKVRELKDAYRLDENVLRLEVFIYERPEPVAAEESAEG